jgi:mannan endo-1,4-beta-mannosidase
MDCPAAVKWVEEHIAHAREIGKPLLLEEFGIYRDGNPAVPDPPVPTEGSGHTVTRDRYFQAFLRLVQDEQLSGALFWCLYHGSYKDYDGFGVYATDQTTVEILRQANRR